MAYTPVPDDDLEVKVYCSAREQIAINVRHYRVTTQVGAGLTLNTLAEILSDEISALYLPMIPATARFEGVSVRKVAPLPISLAVSYTGDADVGTATGDLLPRQVCGLIKFQTDLAGPANRGRLYMPFPSEAFNSDIGEPTDAYVALLDGVKNYFGGTRTWTSGADSMSAVPTIFHKATNSATRISGGTSRQLWAEQHRRGDFGRPNSIIVG